MSGTTALSAEKAKALMAAAEEARLIIRMEGLGGPEAAK